MTPNTTSLGFESTCKELLKATKHEISLAREERRKRKDFPMTQESLEVIKDLEVFGYHIIPGYYAKEGCNAIIKEIKALHINYGSNLAVDEAGSDHRLFGANLVSDLISEFYTDPFIRQVTTYFERTHNFHGFTMAADMVYKEGNLGSGGGWHRDRADQRQLKVLLYLTDVTEENGPFQYFEGTHTPTSILSSVLNHGFAFNQNRFSDEEISRLDQSQLRTVTGKAGTLMFADVRGIHRGMPMKSGERMILMNYSWPHHIPRHIKRQMVIPK